MVGCRAPNTLHAFFLLLVYFFPWNVQGQHFSPDDSDSGLPRTKRGVAKGSPTKKGRSVHPLYSACRYNNVPWSDCDPQTWMRTKTVQLIAEEDFGWEVGAF